MANKKIIKKKYPAGVSYEERLLQELQDPEEARAYLNAALQEEDPRLLLLALKHVVAAQKNLTLITRRAKIDQERLTKLLSSRGEPKLFSLLPVLHAMGLNLSFEPNSRK